MFIKALCYNYSFKNDPELFFTDFFLNWVPYSWGKIIREPVIYFSSINLPWGHVRFYKNFLPDQFSRFDVYWKQTNKQTNRHPDKQSIHRI